MLFLAIGFFALPVPVIQPNTGNNDVPNADDDLNEDLSPSQSR